MDHLGTIKFTPNKCQKSPSLFHMVAEQCPWSRTCLPSTTPYHPSTTTHRILHHFGWDHRDGVYIKIPTSLRIICGISLRHRRGQDQENIGLEIIETVASLSCITTAKETGIDILETTIFVSNLQASRPWSLACQHRLHQGTLRLLFPSQPLREQQQQQQQQQHLAWGLPAVARWRLHPQWWQHPPQLGARERSKGFNILSPLSFLHPSQQQQPQQQPHYHSSSTGNRMNGSIYITANNCINNCQVRMHNINSRSSNNNNIWWLGPSTSLTTHINLAPNHRSEEPKMHIKSSHQKIVRHQGLWAQKMDINILSDNISKKESKSIGRTHIKIVESIEMIILLYLHRTEGIKKDNLGNIEWEEWTDECDNIDICQNNSKSTGKEYIQKHKNIEKNKQIIKNRLASHRGLPQNDHRKKRMEHRMGRMDLQHRLAHRSTRSTSKYRQRSTSTSSGWKRWHPTASSTTRWTTKATTTTTTSVVRRRMGRMAPTTSSHWSRQGVGCTSSILTTSSAFTSAGSSSRALHHQSSDNNIDKRRSTTSTRRNGI